MTKQEEMRRLGKRRPLTKKNIEKYCPEHGVAVIRDKEGRVLYVEVG